MHQCRSWLPNENLGPLSWLKFLWSPGPGLLFSAFNNVRRASPTLKCSAVRWTLSALGLYSPGPGLNFTFGSRLPKAVNLGPWVLFCDSYCPGPGVGGMKAWCFGRFSLPIDHYDDLGFVRLIEAFGKYLKKSGTGSKSGTSWSRGSELTE